MTDQRERAGGGAPLTGGGLRPTVIVRIESGLVAVLAMLGTIAVAPGLWWLPLALFLLFDVSMLGYARSAAAGAFWYNAVHTYIWPGILGAVAIVLTYFSVPEASTWVALIAFAWAFHVGVDRMLGYGLKLPDAFTHTHLGTIGNARRRG